MVHTKRNQPLKRGARKLFPPEYCKNHLPVARALLMFFNTFLSKDNVDNLATLSSGLLFEGYENKLAWINHLNVMEDNASR